MNKYERAIEYFFVQMEQGNIKNDDEQEAYEIAIEVLNKFKGTKEAQEKVQESKDFKYEIGLKLPNGMKIVNRKLFAKGNPRYTVTFYQYGDARKKMVILKESEVDDIMKEA